MAKEIIPGEETPRELIIIRRNGGDDNAAHKGGAWKIAYADFVTAMMAFFLVMWLINSANEATKSRVASYFNPIKMTDAAPSGRGLVTNENIKHSKDKDKKKPDGKTGVDTDKSMNEEKPISDGTLSQMEAEILANPFKSLEKLADEGAGFPAGRTVEMTNQLSGDPFDPRVWETLRHGKTQDEVASSERAEYPNKLVVESKGARPAEWPKLGDAGDKKSAGEADNGRELVTTDHSLETADSTDDKHKQMQFNQAGEELVRELTEKLLTEQRRIGGLQDLKFDVKLTDEGVLIVLEDGKSVSMFRVGSAEPNRSLIAFIGAIGSLLEQQAGNVIVRGHTDARKFHTARFDNWQLSTARAHMASYMLMRGGLSEERIQKIEGYGAAKLLDADDPLAEVNRRVEFVLVPAK